MRSDELLSRLRSLGVRVDMGDDGHLVADFPKGILDDDLRRNLVAQKAELLAILHREEVARAGSLIRERGYVPIRSGTLDGEIILFIRDENAKIPERWHDAMTYTLAELEELRQLEKEDLRLINDTKHFFGGRVASPENPGSRMESDAPEGQTGRCCLAGQGVQ